MTKSKYEILSHNYEIKYHNYGTLSDKYEISRNYDSQNYEISKHSSHKLSKYEILSYNYETASPNYEINHILTSFIIMRQSS